MGNKTPAKVAFLASIYRHLEGFHMPYIKLLQDKGCQVHAFARPDQGKTGIAGAGVICHDTPFKRSPYHPENLKALAYLIKSFREEKFDLLHVHTPVAGILGRIAAKLTGGTQVIYTSHGFHFFQGAPIHYWLLYYPAERFLARYTDYLVTINQEDYHRALSFPVKKDVVYIKGGVGLQLDDFSNIDQKQARDKIKEQLGISGDPLLILCVAEINLNKNQMQLIKTMEKLAAQLQAVCCLLVGTGPEEAKLKDYVKSRSLAGIVYFLGYRQDIPELMAGVDVVVNLSRREGLPRVVIEAMAAGKPVVATGIRGNKDLVVNGQTGFLVPVDNIDATVEALLKLMTDASLRQQMGHSGRERAGSCDIKKTVLEMEKLYEQVIGN
jgi:glycosyltransferase involved in cell wall biosynthesis